MSNDAVRMIAVGAVVEQGGKILLGKHHPERGGFWQGRWICPGGSLEYGETMQAGIKREVKEETDLDIEIGDFIIVFSRQFDQNGKKVTVIYINYWGHVKEGREATAGSDLKEIRWFDCNEIRKLDDLHKDTGILLKTAGVL